MSVKSNSDAPPPARRGVVAVIARQGRLLVIQRSQFVEAPGAYCFPGGALETGEDEAAALVRELDEELNITARPLRRLWHSTTDWNVALSWWHTVIDEHLTPIPNDEEVADFRWLTIAELRTLPGLLSSNHRFLDVIESGEVIVEGL